MVIFYFHLQVDAFDWKSCHSMWKFKSLTWLFAGFAFLHASVNKDANKYIYPFSPPKKIYSCGSV